MRPLFQSWFCPRDCDRKPPAKVDESWDSDKTEPGVGTGGWFGPSLPFAFVPPQPALQNACTKCQATKFYQFDAANKACVGCGKLFASPQGP